MKYFIKFSILMIISSSFLFSNSFNLKKFDNDKLSFGKGNQLEKQMGIPQQMNNNNNNFVKTFQYTDVDNIISVNVRYGQPTKIVFPAFIEKVEMIKKAAGIDLRTEDLQSGTDTLLITRTKEIKDETVIYITVLGKRIIVNIKYADKNNRDGIVNVKMRVSPNSNGGGSNRSSFSPKKSIKSKDLTRQTNLKSVEMVLKMYKGTAADYYNVMNLDGTIAQEQSFFDFSRPKEESVSNSIFKKLFAGNPDFFTLYNNRIIEPVELYIDSYTVVKSNRVKKVLDIFGTKTKWCNYSKTDALQITIDDIKSVFGKNILSVKHPMDKIRPRTCQYVYTVFYKMN